jgi:hypothetical protein
MLDGLLQEVRAIADRLAAAPARPARPGPTAPEARPAAPSPGPISRIGRPFGTPGRKRG